MDNSGPGNLSADPDAITPIAPLSEPSLHSSSHPHHEQALLSKEELDSSHDERPLLRYRRRTVWLLVFYVPLLVLPWILKCVLAVRRIDGGPYVVQSGLSPRGLLSLTSWVAAAEVLGTINGVAAIPLMSALVAQAAVVHCQRRKVKQNLNLHQAFALADRGWSDITILWTARKTGASSRFLWLAFLFITISAIQQPFQSLFVKYGPVVTVTCLDTIFNGCTLLGPATIGHDPEPMVMAGIPQNIVVQAVAADISSTSEYAVDPYIWTEYPNNNGRVTGVSQPYARQMQWYYASKFNLSSNETYFVAALPNGTATGVLREHAMRFNSTTKCERVPSSRFPSVCDGIRPLTAQFSRPGVLEMKVCVPGQFGVYPWTMSRNRQTITEEIYFNVSTTATGSFYRGANMTLHCTTSTTRGYFELGNWHNNFEYGPLEEKWPNPTEMREDYNDHRGAGARFAHPTEQDPPTSGTRFLIWQHPLDRFGTRAHNASGPLMNSAIAIFGNGSFFHTASLANDTTFSNAASRICSQNSIPYSRLGLLKFDDFQSLCTNYNVDQSLRDTTRGDTLLVRILTGWALGWNQTDAAEEALSMAVFAANKAMLTKTVEVSFSFEARPIYTSPGFIVPRPIKTLAGTIVVSVLIFLQLCGIAYATWYIYQMPSWTHALDALAMARLGADVKEAGHDLPPIRALQEKDMTSLTKIDGLVGVEEAGDGETLAEDDGVNLALGGTGLITKKLCGYKEDKKWLKKWRRFWRGPNALDK